MKNTKKTPLKIMLTIMMTLSFNACSSLYGSKESPDPVGIGTDPDELKRSPCACTEVPQNYQQWKKSV